MSLAVQRKQTSQMIAELWQNTFFNQYWRALGTLIGRGTEKAVWVSAAVLMTLNFLLGSTISFLLQETRFLTVPLLLTNLMWCTYTYFMILLTIMIHSRLLDFVRLHLITAIKMEKHVLDLQIWAEQWLGSKVRIILFSLVFASMIAPGGFYALYHTTQFSVGVVLIYFVNFFHLGASLYGLVSMIAFLLRLKNWNLTLYPNDPANTPILLELSEQLRNYLLVFSFAIALFMLLVRFVGVLNILVIIEFLIFDWIPVLTVFFLSHAAFSSLVTRAKHERMSEIQFRIIKLSNLEKLDAKTTTHIMSLMDYHDRVKAVKNSLVNPQAIINLVGSLALPAIATLIQAYVKNLLG